MSIRRSPCDLYLKYLIVRHEAYADEQIVEICRQKQLDALGTYYVRRLRGGMRIPVPFMPETPTHKPSFRFLMTHQLSAFYRPDVHMRTASRLLEMPRAKEVIETMLLSRAPMQWITSALSRDGYPASVDAIKLYKLHYFNLDILDITEIRAILRLRMDAPLGQIDPEEAHVNAAYERARRHDPRIAAANSPISSLACVAAALRLGIRPDTASLAGMASAARSMSVLRMVEAGARDGYDDALRAMQWAAVAKVSNEILESVGSPEADFQNSLLSVSLQTEESAVPTIGVLSDGHHTGEMELHGEHDVESEQQGQTDEAGGSAG